MECREYLIFTLSIAYLGLTSVQPYNPIADQAVDLSDIKADRKVRENFRNLFDSIVTNDGKRSDIYAEVLKQEAARDEVAFDTLKSDWDLARIHNVLERKHFFKTNQMRGNVMTRKREINENNASGPSTNSPTETNDSWLEKDKFEHMIAHHPEALRARVQKMFDECQSLQKKVQFHEDAQNDLLARNEALGALARKLRSFEDWELAMFGRVLDGPLRLHVMRKFLKKLARDDDWAVATAEKFRTAWGILPASNASVVAEIAEAYSNEILSIGDFIYKWCEHRILDMSSVNTTYVDLAIDAGLVQMAESQKDNLCVGYAKWRVTFAPRFTTASTPRMRTVEFYSEKEKYRDREMLASQSSTVGEAAAHESSKPTTATTTEARKSTKTKKKAVENDYYMDSGESASYSSEEGSTNDTDFENPFTRHPSAFRLPNWM